MTRTTKLPAPSCPQPSGTALIVCAVVGRWDSWLWAGRRRPPKASWKRCSNCLLTINTVSSARAKTLHSKLLAAVRRRFNELVAKRQTETIDPAELTELIRIMDEIDQQDAQQLAARKL